MLCVSMAKELMVPPVPSPFEKAGNAAGALSGRAGTSVFKILDTWRKPVLTTKFVFSGNTLKGG